MASLKMFVRRRSSAVDQYIETMRGEQLKVRVWCNGLQGTTGCVCVYAPLTHTHTHTHACTHTHAHTQTSKGDIKTIRSQLHTRRASLNEQIEKEDRIKEGTKKLIGATSDHRTKDQAMLEMNFSESKIKALQAELTKINSSLSAYQAVG